MPVKILKLVQQSILVIILCLLCSTACRRRSEQSEQPILAIDQQIALLEELVREQPGDIGSAVNLSILYALSARLAPNLQAAERTRRSSESVALLAPLLDDVLSRDGEEDKAVYLGLILSQNYLTVGKVDDAWGILDRIDRYCEDNPLARQTLSAGRKALARRIRDGFPLDAPNPWLSDSADFPSQVGSWPDRALHPSKNKELQNAVNNTDKP